MASRSLTSKIERNAVAFSERLAQWERKVFDLQGATELQTRQNINEWLDEMEQTWNQGMVQANTTTGLGTSKAVRAVVGQTIDLKLFREVLGNEILRLSQVDFTKSIVLRNNLALEYGKNWEAFYKEYDDFIKRSLGQTLRQTQEQFMTQAIYVDNISFIDSAGKQWRPKAYSEMWARTRQGEIESEITMSDMNNVGLDVVQISFANTITPICLQHEGKFYSKRGLTPGLPVLPYPTPFHPNCRHVMLPQRGDNVGQMVKMNNKLTKRNDSRLKSVTKDDKKSALKTIDKQETWLRDNREIK